MNGQWSVVMVMFALAACESEGTSGGSPDAAGTSIDAGAGGRRTDATGEGGDGRVARSDAGSPGGMATLDAGADGTGDATAGSGGSGGGGQSGGGGEAMPGGQGGNAAPRVGDPCGPDTVCPAGGSGEARCLGDWPGGYCAVIDCAGHGHDCPEDPGFGGTATVGSRCVLAPEPSCLALCATDDDCRDGYHCGDLEDAAGDGPAKVCVPLEP